MKKLFGRKHKDEETSSNSSFGRNNRTPQNDNPYAQTNADSYANNSYLNAQPSYPQPAGSQSSFRTTQPASRAAGRPGLPSGPRPGGPGQQQPQRPSYGSEPSQYSGASKGGSGYSDEKLGSSAGYGANRYDAGSPAYNNRGSNGYASQRPGGYGGLDQSSLDSTPNVPPPQYSATQPGGSWDAPASQGGQDPYADPAEMTEEQLEDAQVQDIKRATHDTRQDSKASIARSTAELERAIASAESSGHMLAQQFERMDKIEEGADIAIARAREGGAGTAKLDRLNSRPFFIPEGGKKNRQKDVDAQVRRAQEDREAKEETRLAQLERNKKIQQTMGMGGKQKLLGAGKADKYTFEDDDGTEARDEEEINDGIEKMGGLVGQLNFHAHSLNAQLDADPDQPMRIAEKMTKADDKVTRINARLNTIR
ncbi:hypothetical protein QBC37DRAFT_414323 [Rhypophila decipiens]|uniref:t-SNARE coiled-coil homology domain-containing protein n=1 Tax=Rhypophila decipiens TaxID=261697 RepID=A0AAN7BE39_9PEZI|nr:hypothetical protein QBC37DRAFT_414323 [Rhypophila decipiens]